MVNRQVYVFLRDCIKSADGDQEIMLWLHDRIISAYNIGLLSYSQFAALDDRIEDAFKLFKRNR